jgi:hypothetical protein
MIFMVKSTAGIEIPDSKLATEAADILREYGNEILWNHSHRVEQYGIPKESTQLVWDAIALHTTIRVAQYKQPVVALVYHRVGFDVMGDRFEELSEQTRTQVMSAFPRDGFKYKILYAFLDGFKHKPQTTFGNIKADVCERLIPGYKSPNFCDLVLQSPWDDGKAPS